MKVILSKNNEFIKKLKKQKIKNKSLLFLDNFKTIREAVNNKIKLKYLLVCKDKQNLLADFACQEKYAVSLDIIKEFSDVKTPQGIIAIFDFQPKELSLPKENFLVLDGLQDAGNVGSLIRSALGANFCDVFLLDCVALTNPKTIRSATSAVFKANVFQTTRQNFISFAKNNNLQLVYADMNGKSVYQTSLSGFGLVLGNEGNGVSKEIKNICQQAISIPMKNNLESLNVAIAGAVIMFEIRRRVK